MSCRAVAAIALAGALAAAKTVSLIDRVAVGECAESTAAPQSLFDSTFQVSDLPSEYVARVENLIDLGHTKSAVELLIDYGQNFKVLTDDLSQEQYVLTQCGTEQPSDAQIDAVKPLPAGSTGKHFTIPVQTIVATSTVQLTFIEALGLEDRVLRIPGGATGACWQLGLSDCNAQLESDWVEQGGAWVQQTNQEQLDEAELVLLDCDSYQPVDCAKVKNRNNSVHFASTTALAGNLHSAEFIKWLAVFFNKDNEANALFDGSANLYTASSTAADTANSPAKKKVAWIDTRPYGAEDNFKLLPTIYKQEFVTAAGGLNVDGDSVKAEIGENMAKTVDAAGNPTFTLDASKYASKAAAGAALLAALGDVDILIDETYAKPEEGGPHGYTIDTFLSSFNASSISKKVLRVDGTLSEVDGLDWFESRVAYPHLAVQGLKRVMLPDDSLPKRYFRDISTGENPTVVTKSECTKPLPICNTSLDPKPIAMPEQTAPDDEVSAAQHTAVSAPAIALAAVAAAVVASTALLRG